MIYYSFTNKSQSRCALNKTNSDQPKPIILIFVIYKNLRWAVYAPMTTARENFPLVWSPDGRLFAVGGSIDKQAPTASVEMLYCPWDTEGEAGGAWKRVASMCRSRQLHGACFFEEKLFAAGGIYEESVECFVLPSVDLPNGQWTMVRPVIDNSCLKGLFPFNGGLLMVGEWHTFYLKLHTNFNHKVVYCTYGFQKPDNIL